LGDNYHTGDVVTVNTKKTKDHATELTYAAAIE
jgi:hypothetical protein